MANPRAGLFLRDRISGPALRSYLDDADVHTVPGRDLTKAAEAAVKDGAPLVVAAGGDGTVNAVAAALVGTPAALGVLPLGTMNHFAKDLGVPLALEAAAQILAAPDHRWIDVGVLGDRIFVNNASFGVYPKVLETREAIQETLGRSRWPAMAMAMFDAVKRSPTLTAYLELAGRQITARTPFVFVGNNPYEVNLFSIGGRPRLDTGRLGVYYSRQGGRAALLRLSWRAFTGRLDQEADFVAHQTRRLRIDAPRPELRVALDGEVHRVRPPVHLSVRPAALRVALPGAAA